MSFFKNPNDPLNEAVKNKIKEWVIQEYKLKEDLAIIITEHECWEPNCPDVSTNISFTIKGKEYKINIRKPLVYLRKWDIPKEMPLV